MKSLLAVAALALAACSANTPIAPTAPASTATSAATAAMVATISAQLAHSSAKPIPSFEIGTQSADDVTPDNGIKIHSVYLIVKAEGRTVKGYLNGSCWLRYVGREATGCYVSVKKTLYMKVLGGLYTGYNATGCLAAVGEYKGEVYAGGDVPFTWYRTYNC